MIPHKQLFRHRPLDGVFGDCHRTAIACLLNLPSPEYAPHFVGMHEEAKLLGDNFDWAGEQEKWLNALGFTTVDIQFDASTCELEQLFKYMEMHNPLALYLLGGTSPRGSNHTVICHGGGFRHDPHPDGGFLVGPLGNGFWCITFILPLIMKENIL